jgi:membrane protein YdbS with pleckstrin-like domain
MPIASTKRPGWRKPLVGCLLCLVVLACMLAVYAVAPLENWQSWTLGIVIVLIFFRGVFSLSMALGALRPWQPDTYDEDEEIQRNAW